MRHLHSNSFIIKPEWVYIFIHYISVSLQVTAAPVANPPPPPANPNATALTATLQMSGVNLWYAQSPHSLLLLTLSWWTKGGRERAT